MHKAADTHKQLGFTSDCIRSSEFPAKDPTATYPHAWDPRLIHEAAKFLHVLLSGLVAGDGLDKDPDQDLT
jgi:hypothetical protein